MTVCEHCSYVICRIDFQNLTTNLSRLKDQLYSMQATVTMMIHSQLRKLLLCDVEDNTQLIPSAPVVLVEHDLVLGPDDEVCGKSLYKMQMKEVSTWVYLFGHARLLYRDLENTVMLQL